MADLSKPRSPDAEPITAPDQVTLPSEGAPGYEVRDIRLKPIFYATLALVGSALVVQLLTWLLFDLFEARELAKKTSDRPLAGELRRAEPPEPRLQRAPLEDLAALRAWEERLLTTYAVLERSTGTVRIPIERAMDLVAERGLPARKAPEAKQPAAEPHAVAPRPASPAQEKPAVEKPVAEKPVAEKPAPRKPAVENPAAEKPAAEKPAEKPAAEQPAAEALPAPDEQHTGAAPAAEAQPAAAVQPEADAPAEAQPAPAAQPAAEAPADAQPQPAAEDVR